MKKIIIGFLVTVSLSTASFTVFSMKIFASYNGETLEHFTNVNLYKDTGLNNSTGVNLTLTRLMAATIAYHPYS